MKRFLLRTTALAACAVWVAGCAGDTKGSASPAATNDAPVTLDSEIASAHALREKGDFQGAAKAFGQLMLIDPDDSRVVSEYGKTMLEAGRPEDALPFLKRSLEIQASDWTVYSAVGVAYDQVGEHGNARIAYERALALKPGAPQVLNNFAVSRMMVGDLEGARRLLAQASTSADPKIQANLELLASKRRVAARMARSKPAETEVEADAKPASLGAASAPVPTMAPKPAPVVADAKPASVPAGAAKPAAAAAVEARPTNVPAVLKPATTTVEAKPAQVPAQLKPATTTAETKPAQPTATKPATTTAEAKPVQPAAAKPATTTAEAKPAQPGTHIASVPATNSGSTAATGAPRQLNTATSPVAVSAVAAAMHTAPASHVAQTATAQATPAHSPAASAQAASVHAPTATAQAANSPTATAQAANAPPAAANTLAPRATAQTATTHVAPQKPTKLANAQAPAGVPELRTADDVP